MNDDDDLTPEEREILRRNDPRIAGAGQRVEARPDLQSAQEGGSDLDPPIRRSESDALPTGRLIGRAG